MTEPDELSEPPLPAHASAARPDLAGFASDADAPAGWLFRPSTLGGSFRVYLPTVMLARVLGLARTLVFAWLILQTEVGLYRLALQLVNLLVSVVRLGLPSGFERYTPQYEQRGQLTAFLRRGMWLGLATAAAVTLALAAGAGEVARLAFQSNAIRPAAHELAPTAGYLVRLTLVCLGVTLGLAMYFNLMGVLRGLRMYRALAVMEILHGVTLLIFGVAGLQLAGCLSFRGGVGLTKLPGAALALMTSYGLSIVATMLFVGLGLRRHLRGWPSQRRPLDEPLRRSAGLLMRFSSYMIVPNLVWTTFSIFGLWYVNKLYGEREAGLFALPRDMMQTVQLLAMAIWPTAQNSAIRLWEQGRREHAVEQLGLVFRLSGWPLWLVCVGLVLCRTTVIHIMPPDYARGVDLLAWQLVAFMFLIHLSLPTAHAFLLEDSRVLLVSAALAMAVHAGTAVWLVPRWAAFGASQSAACGAAAGVAALLALILVPARRDRRWITARDVPLLLAPVLLILPALLGRAGDALLAAAAGAVLLMLAMTTLLWAREDRRLLGNYLSSSWRIITRSGRVR